MLFTIFFQESLKVQMGIGEAKMETSLKTMEIDMKSEAERKVSSLVN